MEFGKVAVRVDGRRRKKDSRRRVINFNQCRFLL